MDSVKLHRGKVPEISRALVNRDVAFGQDWSVMSADLLELVRTGEGALEYSVKGIGDIRVRGAGRRDLTDRGHILSMALERRVDRVYLTLVVRHVDAEEKPKRAYEYDGVVHIATTPTTLLSDSAGVALRELVGPAAALGRATRAHRRLKNDHPRYPRSARRIMDARNNLLNQFASKVVKHAKENNLAVSTTYIDDNCASHPKVLGGAVRMRKELLDKVFAQCDRNGVMFLNPHTSTALQYKPCPHPSDVAVSVIKDETIFAMCSTCAQPEECGRVEA